MKKICLILIIVPIIFFSFYGNASARAIANVCDSATANTGSATLQNPLQACSVSEVLLAAVDLAIFIGVIIAVLMFIFIGLKFVLAQGNETKLKDAKMWFLYAVIGTAVLISSKVIVEVVRSTLVSTGVVKNF